MENFHENLTAFVEQIEKMNSDKFSELVTKYLDDDSIEIMASHIEQFYGVEDDDEIGGLTQIMITGYLAAMSMDLKN